VGNIAKKQSEGMRFLLIRHSKFLLLGKHHSLLL